MKDRNEHLWVPPVSRRQFLIASGAAAVLAACGSDGGSGGTTATTGAPATTGAGGAATTAAGVATTAVPAGGIKTGGTLRVGMVGGTNDIIDGQFIVAKTDIARLITGWEGLVNYDEDFAVVNEYGLSEELIVEAPDLYTIRLREGIEFHNGKTVTADDVVYSFNRMIDPDLGISPNVASLLSSDGIIKVDDRTVQFQLNQPVVTFKDALAAYTTAIVPDGYTREGEQVGTGPYKLESFTPGVESRHVRNENYWRDGQPYLDEVQIIDFGDPVALVNALLAGQVDVIADLPFAQVTTVESNSGFTILESSGGGWLPITMAVDQAPFDDPRVRQAMRLIVDREEMVQRVLSGHGSVANDLYGLFDVCYGTSGIEQRTRDIDKAMALLEEAGQAGLEIDLFAPNDTAGLAEMATAFADQAKDAGVTVNVQVLDGGTYWGEEYTKRTFATSFWAGRPYLSQVAAGSLKTATYQETHWPPDGSDFTARYDEALATVDDDARCDIIHEMMREEWEDGGNIISFFNNLIDAYADNVKGFVARPNQHNLDHYGRGFQNVWLDV